MNEAAVSAAGALVPRQEGFVAAPCGPVRYVCSPAPRAAKGTVVLLPGRGEFIEKHAAVLAHFEGHGFATACLDWRGQGGSCRLLASPSRGYVTSFDDYLEDLSLLLERLEDLRLPRPWLMVGHSMGGHIGLRYLAEREHPFEAAAMIAPMFDIHFGPVPRPLARAVARAGVRLGLGRCYAPGQRDPSLLRCSFERNPLTSCPESFAAWRRLLADHPDKVIGGVTLAWLDASLRSIDRTRAPGYLEAVRVPLLVCRAGLERVVCPRAPERFVARLPNATLVDFADGRHDLLWERPSLRRRVLERVTAFLREVMPGRGPHPRAA